MNTQYTTATRAHTPSLDSLNGGLFSLSNAVNDHATRIDTIYAELNDLKGFYMWVTDTYPEHMQQYRAVLDLKQAGA
jgi:hypothetical protein